MLTGRLENLDQLVGEFSQRQATVSGYSMTPAAFMASAT